MPFVAYLGDERVVSLDLDTIAWSGLRESPEYNRLSLACGLRAITKISKLGTQFFAHYRTAGCTLNHLGESENHRAMKQAVAEYINTLHGWNAVLEYANEDRSWIADVMAFHEDGRRAAFEIQLSPQAQSQWEARSQQYFDVGIMPVWVTPLRDWYEDRVSIPALRVPFRKASTLPQDPAALLLLPAGSWMGDPGTLGETIAKVLSSRPPWTKGTPRSQREAHASENRRWELEEHRREAAAKRLEAQVEKNNADARAPFAMFQPAVVHSDTETPFFAWATVIPCWKCRGQMLLWFASRKNKLGPLTQVGVKRFENHPEVHRAINAWIHVSSPRLPKAKIKPLAYNGGPVQASFVCPHCDNVQGQFFVGMLRHEKWSRIIVPTGFDASAP